MVIRRRPRSPRQELRAPSHRPAPLAEAISSAGGRPWHELDAHLMLRNLPGVFVAGEMIDWEAPTGGYLIQGCFATGTRAALGAVRFLSRPESAAADFGFDKPGLPP